MKNLFLLFTFVSIGSVLCFAETWNGTLVDADCVHQQTAQKAPDAALPVMAQACPATSSTKSFAVQVASGEVYNLNAAGNAKAATAIQGGKSQVTIEGTRHGKTINVKSLDLQ